MFKKLFEPTALEKWWDSLPTHTQIYLKNQPVWHDRDMFIAGGVGAVVGFLISLLFLA